MLGAVPNRRISKLATRTVPAVAIYWVFLCLCLSLTIAESGRAQDLSDDTDADAFLENEESTAISTPVTEPTTDVESDSSQLVADSQNDTEMVGEAPEAPEAQTPSQEDQEDKKDDDLMLDLGGGFVLYYYQPLEGDADNYFEVFEARLRLDAEFSIFGIHVAPVFRDTVERGFFPSTTWIEEAYAWMRLQPITLKVGKVYRQFGKFWDNSFYGNVQEYDGLKLDPNHGISLEGSIAESNPIGLRFYLQYFIIDGTTNYALPGRDTHTIPNSHRRNQIVGRLEPFFRVGDAMVIKVGVSGEYFQADLETIGKQDVGRLAGDATVSAYGFSLWGEFTQQFGRHVVDFPFEPSIDENGVEVTPGISSDSVTYIMAGCEYTIDILTIRYNFNMGDYGDIDYAELRHIPGVSVKLHKYLSVLLEWAYASKDTGGKTERLDNSINLTIHGKI